MSCYFLAHLMVDDDPAEFAARQTLVEDVGYGYARMGSETSD